MSVHRDRLGRAWLAVVLPIVRRLHGGDEPLLLNFSGTGMLPLGGAEAAPGVRAGTRHQVIARAVHHVGAVLVGLEIAAPGIDG